tara:strand:+ start:1555 stop:1977 length:423 start_codon:yes stop_codon:yes gene_type:complete
LKIIGETMTQTALLTPVFTLILWTFAITAIMAYGRVRFTKDPQDAAHTRDLKGMMPAWVERTADNYNHLFEQPVAFYVVTLSIALMNNIEPLMVQLAWGFVFVRIIHSLVQLTINIVLLRFAIFAIGWLIIAYMALSQLI